MDVRMDLKGSDLASDFDVGIKCHAAFIGIELSALDAESKHLVWSRIPKSLIGVNLTKEDIVPWRDNSTNGFRRSDGSEEVEVFRGRVECDAGYRGEGIHRHLFDLRLGNGSRTSIHDQGEAVTWDDATAATEGDRHVTHVDHVKMGRVSCGRKKQRAESK